MKKIKMTMLISIFKSIFGRLSEYIPVKNAHFTPSNQDQRGKLSLKESDYKFIQATGINRKSYY